MFTQVLFSSVFFTTFFYLGKINRLKSNQILYEGDSSIYYKDVEELKKLSLPYQCHTLLAFQQSHCQHPLHLLLQLWRYGFSVERNNVQISISKAVLLGKKKCKQCFITDRILPHSLWQFPFFLMPSSDYKKKKKINITQKMFFMFLTTILLLRYLKSLLF